MQFTAAACTPCRRMRRSGFSLFTPYDLTCAAIAVWGNTNKVAQLGEQGQPDARLCLMRI